MDLTSRIVEITTALVAIPTHEREQEAQELLAGMLEAVGFACELHEVLPGRPNLIARRGEGGPFLCSHIDVHPPHAHPDPFTVHRQGALLVGRGVLDAKGQIAALVAAAEAAPDAQCLIAICCDEEFEGLGSDRIVVPDGPWFTDGGIVLEPTAFRICTVQTGHIDLVIEASAPSGHTYDPPEGGTPIDIVLAATAALRGSSFLTEHPLLPKPRVHVGTISGGEHVWRSPARARTEIAIGILPGVDLDAAVSEVGARIDDALAASAHEGVSVLYDVVSSSPGIEITQDLPIISTLANAMGELHRPAGMPSWTDAANLLLVHGLPCVVFGAGELNSAHSDWESVAVADLVRLSEILRDVIG